MTTRPAFARRTHNHIATKKQGRKLKPCPQSIYPMFDRVCMAEGYAATCRALYNLARELFRRGQPFFNVSHDLGIMRRDYGLIVEEVVLHAWKGGAA